MRIFIVFLFLMRPLSGKENVLVNTKKKNARSDKVSLLKFVIGLPESIKHLAKIASQITRNVSTIGDISGFLA